MKTKMILSAIGLGLLLTTAVTLFAGQPVKPVLQEDPSNSVIFKVNIHLNSDLQLHHQYMVELLDDHGWLIAPPQVYQPGVMTYYFSKPAWRMASNSNLVWKLAVTAKLVAVSSTDPGTAAELYTRPVRRIVLLAPGVTYSYDLFPVLKTNVGSSGDTGGK